MSQELSLKASTTLTEVPYRKTQALSDGNQLKCDVDECMVTEILSCEVRVTEPHKLPDGETHLVDLCPHHHSTFATIQWTWKMNPDAGTRPDASLLTLEEIIDVNADKEWTGPLPKGKEPASPVRPVRNSNGRGC